MPNFNPYTNQFYIQDLQNMKDRIDTQMRQLQQNQYTAQQPPITQNFQLAPTQPNSELESKYASSIDEVKNTFVIKTGVFVNKDFTTMWVKDVTGTIKTYKLDEVVELDEKDKKLLEKDNIISALQKQINELKEVINYANSESTNNELDESITTKKSKRISSSKPDNE